MYLFFFFSCCIRHSINDSINTRLKIRIMLLLLFSSSFIFFSSSHRLVVFLFDFNLFSNRNGMPMRMPCDNNRLANSWYDSINWIKCAQCEWKTAVAAAVAAIRGAQSHGRKTSQFDCYASRISIHVDDYDVV